MYVCMYVFYPLVRQRLRIETQIKWSWTSSSLLLLLPAPPPWRSLLHMPPSTRSHPDSSLLSSGGADAGVFSLSLSLSVCLSDTSATH